MRRSRRSELEPQVQGLDREHPEWSSSEIERELRVRHPAMYGDWAEETPEVASRRRAVQRWRGSGGRALAARQARAEIPFLWPVGERQRRELDPGYLPSSRLSAGSWRIFLYNCAPETLREIHVALDRVAVGYSPFLLPGRFLEVLWQRVEPIKEATLATPESAPSGHLLRAQFVRSRGTREGRLEGTLQLRTDQGWLVFDGGNGRTKELE
jgi:hypothetical protein